jgi:hypothetical protein
MPHYRCSLAPLLDATFSNKWHGQGGPIGWPPRSPDLPHLDFHFWGYIKDKIYVPPLPQSSRGLRERIRDAVMSVDEDILRRVWDEIAFSCGVSRIARGSHIEHLWTKLECWATVVKKFVSQWVTWIKGNKPLICTLICGHLFHKIAIRAGIHNSFSMRPLHLCVFKAPSCPNTYDADVKIVFKKEVERTTIQFT